MKLTRLIKIAQQEAEKSEHNYKLGAVVFKHGKVISKGFNKTNRGINKDYGHWSGSLHAELAAIIAARTDLKGSRLLVTRRGGGLARPCKHCMAAIKEAGVKWIYYTAGHGIDRERIQ